MMRTDDESRDGTRCVSEVSVHADRGRSSRCGPRPSVRRTRRRRAESPCDRNSPRKATEARLGSQQPVPVGVLLKKTRPAAQETGLAGRATNALKTQRRRIRRRLTCPAARRPALRAFPFGGSRTACRCTVQVTLPGTASREGSVLLGVLSAAGARGYRVPRSRQGLGISAGSSGIVRPPSAVSFRIAASSSLELSASSRVLRPTTCPPYPGRPRDRPEARERLPWGSHSLIATSAGDVH